MKQKPTKKCENGVQLRPASIEEAGLFYSELDEKQDEALGTVGHIRMDFGSGGKEFWHTWWPHNEDRFNTLEFKEELQAIVDTLRANGPLKDLAFMSNYCHKNGGAITEDSRSFGYVAETDHYRYCLRCTPTPGDYQGYLYCYDKRQQEMAQKDKIVGRVTFADGTSQEFTDPHQYLQTIKEELPLRNTTGFKHETLSEDPEIKKAVDDILLDFAGEENPRRTCNYGLTEKGLQALRDVADPSLPHSYAWFVMTDCNTPQEQLHRNLTLDEAVELYGEADSPYFPSDIDNYALEYFGSEQYYSDKFQDEAYLFIPFDENYYQAMAKVMEKRFVNWQGQSFDEATLKPSDLAEAMMEYLDCECTYFPSMTDDDPIMSAYNYAKRESVKEGFVPVLIKANDEILWECLIMNSDPDSDGEDDYAFDPDKVAEYRKKMLSAPVENSKAVLEEMIGQRKEEAEDDDMDWDEEILGKMEGGYDNRRFSSYWNSDNNMTYPLILAKIPVKNPWEIFAYLPFGGWNECPNTPELMAVAKYWFEQHGAVPAAMSHDELEFLLPAPVPEEKAMDAAVELYGFCPDVIDQGPEDATVGTLADVLRQSTVWYFWWD